MTEYPNATLIRRGYLAFSAGDVATLSGVIAPDAVQHMPGNNMFSGDHRGLEKILERYGRLAQESGGTLQRHCRRLEAEDKFWT